MADKMTPEDLNNLTNSANNVSESLDDYNKTLKSSGQALKNSGIDLGSALLRGASGASVYNDVIQKSTDLGKAAAAGHGKLAKGLAEGADVAGKYAQASLKQADTLFDSFQKISRSGVAVGMKDTFKNLQDAGYTMAEIGKYGSLMQENSSVLARLGGTTADGAAQFAKAAKNIHESGLEGQFLRMGMTVDDINGGMANYIKQQQLAGSTLQRDDNQIAQSAAEFIMEQDKLTKLTGMSADEQNKVYEAAMATEQYASHAYELQKKIDAGGAEGKAAEARLQYEKEVMVWARMQGPERAKQVQMMLAGDVTSKAYQAGTRMNRELAAQLQSGNNDLGATVNAGQRDAKNTADRYSKLAQSGNFEAIGGSYSEYAKTAASAGKDTAKILEDIHTQQVNQGKGTDAAVAAEAKIRQDQRDVVKTFDLALNKGVEPLTAGMTGLSGLTEQLAGVLGQLAGKEGRVGGGSTLLEKFGFKSSAAGGAAGGTVPVGSGPPGGSKAGENVDDVIKFSGGTGDKSHFMQLNSSVLQNFVAMATDYFGATGDKLQVNSAFRSADEQAAVNSGGNPKAAPGKSLHNIGKAIDINASQVSALQSKGLLGQYGFSPLNGDPPHIQMPSAATGGILSGPSTGFPAMLHNTEAVIPITSNKSIPVQDTNTGSSGSKYTTQLLTMELERLDSILKIMSRQNAVSDRILQLQH